MEEDSVSTIYVNSEKQVGFQLKHWDEEITGCW